MDIFQALADPNRRLLMAQLNQAAELSIADLNLAHVMSRQALSKHLHKLVAAGIVKKRKQGKESLHSLDPDSLKVVAEWLQPYAARWDQRLDNLKQFSELKHQKGE